VKKIAIVGHGFVGKAVDYGFSNPDVQKIIIDPKYGNSIADIPSTVDAIFVCVPTPMGNFSIIKDVVSELSKRKLTDVSTVVIKSTVPPNVLFEFSKWGVVYNPEFLREANANEDFVNPPMHVFGGPYTKVKKLERLYKTHSLCKPCPVFKVSIEEASAIKYTINSFLATKVMFFNQIYQMAEDNGLDFNRIVNAVGSDPRIGQSHTRVPGFDGKFGFGGACFPKDTLAFTNYSNKLTVLAEAVARNNDIRKNYELDDREKEQEVEYE
jgi:UDPglucose 6-dehydrogenase